MPILSLTATRKKAEVVDTEMGAAGSLQSSLWEAMSAQGVPAGDLYVKIHVRKDAKFDRDGINLTSALPIKLTDALLGRIAPLRSGDQVDLAPVEPVIHDADLEAGPRVDAVTDGFDGGARLATRAMRPCLRSCASPTTATRCSSA